MKPAPKHKSGHLDVVIPVTSDDEIGTVSRAFNNMSAELAGREREKADIAWQQNGKLQFDEVMRSADGIADLAAKAINFLGDYLEAPAGAFFCQAREKRLHLYSRTCPFCRNGQDPAFP